MSKLEKLVKYIAENNPRGVIMLANKHGFKHPNTDEGREGLLFKFVTEEGNAEGLRGLAQIHPDRELILSAEPEGVYSFTGEATGEERKKPSLTGLVAVVILFILIIAVLNGKL